MRICCTLLFATWRLQVSAQDLSLQASGSAGRSVGSEVAAGPSALTPDDAVLLQRVETWLGGLTAQRVTSPQRVYRYKVAGRNAFTNIIDQVPVAQRSEALVDLDHVSLNSDLGRRINARLASAHAAFAASSTCARARAQDDGWFARGRRFFERHTASSVFAMLSLLLLLMTPVMVRRVDPAAWKRVLMFALPALGALSMFSYSVDMRAALLEEVLVAPLAERCDPAIYRQLDAQHAPLSLRMALMRTLDSQRAALDKVAAEAQAGAPGL